MKLVLAWLPFAALWALISISAEGIDIASAARYGSVSAGTAALLGYGVWRLTGRYPWPYRVSAGFYLTHSAFGALFAVAWMVGGMVVNSLLVGLPVLGWYLSASLTFWRFVMGLFLYGLIAGVSYSMRIREQLREQEKATLAAQALAAQGKLESLRAQLNPHFLFNALHSVSELMHSDAAAAERALEGLAGLLRYSLDSDAGEMVSLADEWEFVEGYLELERLRLGERLQLQAELSDAALAAVLPGFTLQVLVENSVRHAVATRPERGRIGVRARLDSGTLHLEVSDDGPGFDATQVADRGRGLELLRRRLEVAHHGRARLEIDSTPGSGTTVRVTVPQVRGGGAGR